LWITGKEVAKKIAKRTKHVPQRTCVGCHLVLAKRGLVRIVRTADGPRIDSTGKAAGRGAYLHALRACWERALKGPLAHALKTELSEHDREILRMYMARMPDDAEETVAVNAESDTKGAEQPM
jgi:predicted RNA-binding protein YlxR (DUF448 family)